MHKTEVPRRPAPRQPPPPLLSPSVSTLSRLVVVAVRETEAGQATSAPPEARRAPLGGGEGGGPVEWKQGRGAGREGGGGGGGGREAEGPGSMHEVPCESSRTEELPAHTPAGAPCPTREGRTGRGALPSPAGVLPRDSRCPCTAREREREGGRGKGARGREGGRERGRGGERTDKLPTLLLIPAVSLDGWWWRGSAACA